MHSSSNQEPLYYKYATLTIKSPGTYWFKPTLYDLLDELSELLLVSGTG